MNCSKIENHSTLLYEKFKHSTGQLQELIVADPMESPT
jgi:hypothetical protein